MLGAQGNDDGQTQIAESVVDDRGQNFNNDQTYRRRQSIDSDMQSTSTSKSNQSNQLHPSTASTWSSPQPFVKTRGTASSSSEASVDRLVELDPMIWHFNLQCNFSCYSFCFMYEKLREIDRMESTDIAKLLFILRTSFMILVVIGICKLLSLTMKTVVNPIQIEQAYTSNTTMMSFFISGAVFKVVLFAMNMTGLLGLLRLTENDSAQHVHRMMMFTTIAFTCNLVEEAYNIVTAIYLTEYGSSMGLGHIGALLASDYGTSPLRGATRYLYLLLVLATCTCYLHIHLTNHPYINIYVHVLGAYCISPNRMRGTVYGGVWSIIVRAVPLS
jgi:hypothetical protein